PERIGAAGRTADRGEGIEEQRIGDREAVRHPVGDAATGVRRRFAVTGTVDADDPNAGARADGRERGRFHAAARPAVAPNDRGAVRSTVVDEADGAVVGQRERACVGHRVSSSRSVGAAPDVSGPSYRNTLGGRVCREPSRGGLSVVETALWIVVVVLMAVGV